MNASSFFQVHLRKKKTMALEETKIIYHIDDEDTPYLVKVAVPPDRVTLGDFKSVLNRPNYKFFFKSMDDDFGYDYFISFIHFCVF